MTSGGIVCCIISMQVDLYVFEVPLVVAQVYLAVTLTFLFCLEETAAEVV